MNFSDLLDEDGQGIRRCDAWLAENIENEDVKKRESYYIYNNFPEREFVTHFTTGDSIDPIWELAKNQGFPTIEPAPGGWKAKLTVVDGEILEESKMTFSESDPHHDEKTAIAEALFKAYQKENAITTEEALDKYSDLDKSYPPGEGE